ncbi:Probable leucine-rich repeat receptor-like protein kinase [Striga hermonthica]|uniref:Probable leucine-rich repeat receptor-like protein kinase n=1 Tax=Striga hermonthica TaxID=68872 RepID=A0A9N7RIH6_STRHE|nr:Probable leucine-rich repeat receptor-like protein kinase [Striga hermonthica]
MSRLIYDNWERLVLATLRREQLWQLCHADSTDLSIISLSLTSSCGRSFLMTDIGSSRLYHAVGYEPQKPVTWYVEETRDGSTILVKRTRGDNKTLLPITYFSYDCDEKLFVYEYQTQTSKIATNLMNWESRLKIATVVAKAIALAHAKPTTSTHPSGDFSGSLLNDLGSSSALRLAISTAGYCSPEAAHHGIVSWASDVYTFGVLLLELLTIPSPLNIRGSSAHREQLVKRVAKALRDEGTLIVFHFIPTNVAGELIEMWKVLLLALRCVEEDPQRRPAMGDVVKMLEGVKQD